ncbi:ABC transporter substrate-binding protein [Tistrella mobilis]|uniref:Periplasmic binding protein n=1 Tax=Tistrella mobilis (strain KA081020-065) TaxID=1110502 RepID=I3TUA3_TISMK|nr:ABC transporter substrate-binding protein [Tistrella mobilis]AFK56341.1 periplasmic binding protein [Tistrella mobilis KA081020-065]
MTITRRHLIAGLVSAPLLPAVARAAASTHQPADLPRRIVALDWSSAETLIMLGRPPVGIVRIPDYRAWVVEPPLPDGVADVGMRLEPNLEVVQALAPDLILIAPGLEAVRARLESIAPTLRLQVFTPGRPAFPAAIAETRRLGQLLGLEDATEAALAAAEARMDRARAQLTRYDGRPLYVVNVLDDRHVRVLGQTGLWQAALDRLGLANAWTGDSGPWGMATVGLERLTTNPEARLVHVAPGPAGFETRLRTSPLWRHFDMIRAGRVVGLPAVFPFGAVPCTVRFAECLSRALAAEAGA